MIDLEIYKLAFDILIETLINHQKHRESEENLDNLVAKLNDFFNTQEFSNLLKDKITFYKNQLLEEDESLFLSKSHIPYIIRRKYLVLPQEKLAIFLIVKSWSKQFDFPNPVIFNKIGVYFEIRNEDLVAINEFCDLAENIYLSNNFISIYQDDEKIKEDLEGEWAELNKNLVENNSTFKKEELAKLNILYLNEYNSFIVRYPKGQKGKFILNGKQCFDEFCLVKYGDILYYSDDHHISFADLKRNLVENKYQKKFRLSVEMAEMSTNIKRGIRPFNFYGLPGELIGVIGNEGVGKSTLLKIISGIEKPKKGKVLVNGYNLEHFKFQLSGFVGYVPEEDLLYYGLSASENLKIAAQLYSRGLSIHETDALVDSVLNELEISSIADTIVGKPSLKKIQPGQRRLLNIALELIRDPQVLVIDNAVSSLSLNDSSKVLEILAKLTFKGKLIITTITQTSKESFELFDKLFVISHDGYPLYFGDRNHALKYLLEKLPQGIQRNITTTDNYTPDKLIGVLNIFKSSSEESKKRENDNDTNDLYNNFISQTSNQTKKYSQKTKIPGVSTYPPKLEKQYLVYSYRTFKAKLAEKRDLLFSLFTAPIIGAITALFLKSSDGSEYYYGLNPNIPLFIYLSILILLFNGLAQTSREIIREKHLLIKEEYLHLSLFSYINSKITFFLGIILIQSFLYTWITSAILEVKGMFLYDYIVYFSCGVSGALLGLLFTSSHTNLNSLLMKSIPITFYILLILGGGWIQFKDFSFTKDKYTPVLADFMVTRWAYESLMVEHYTNNKYQKNINVYDQQISRGTFQSFHVIPKLKEWTGFLIENDEKTDSSIIIQKLLVRQLKKYEMTEDIYPFEYLEELDQDISLEILEEAQEYISYLDYYYYKKYNDGFNKKKQVLDSITNRIGINNLDELKLNNYNIYIAQKVQNSSSRESQRILSGDLVQLSAPIYQKPLNNFGRALLFLPEKRFNDQVIKTFEFNLSIIWLFNFILYIFLITDLVNRLKRNR